MSLFDKLRKKSDTSHTSAASNAGQDAAQTSAAPAKLSVTPNPNTVFAPASGQVIDMENIPDPVFASGAMGKALGVEPKEGVVYAPVSGQITAGMPHAQGILSDDGIEVLIHVGIDTVNMRGDGFTVYTKHGQHVEAGEPLLTFDRQKVAEAGYKDIVITVITNTDDFKQVEAAPEASISAGSTLFIITR